MDHGNEVQDTTVGVAVNSNSAAIPGQATSAGRTHFETIIVGAGIAGIGAAIKLRQAGLDFVVLEKSGELGGVWRDNTYPDCACDVPSPLYSYSFAPNPEWSRLFAPQKEIKAYTRDTAARFQILESIRLHHELQEARWNVAEQRWDLKTSKGEFGCRFLILACGPMHVPVTPRIQGAESFPGPAFHSARWDHAVDLTGKKVAVIGTGASAIQFVPAIQPVVGNLTVFQRTPPWVLPKFDRRFSDRAKEMFRRFPILQSAMRTALYGQFEILNSSLNRVGMRERLQRAAKKNIARSVKDEAMRSVLTPTYDIGCKRILLSNKWYRALASENVEVLGGVSGIEGKTIVADDGRTCEADVLIYATGFEVANPPIAKHIVGESGVPLAERWAGSPTAYLGTMVEDCPNCFLTFGPNLYTYTSAFVIVEAQLKFILSAIKGVRSAGLTSIAVDAGKNAAYNDDVQKSLASTVWNRGGCTSYFIDKNGVNSTNWPWSTLRMRRRLRRFRLGDYRVTRESEPVRR